MLRFFGRFLVGISLLSIGASGAEDAHAGDQGSNMGPRMLVKRGYSSGNDFGPPMQVSSGIIYLDKRPRPVESAEVMHAVWLEPDSGVQNHPDVHAVLEAHPSGGSGGFGGSISSIQAHEGDLGGQLSSHVADGHVSGTLHTQISDNVDFHNVADAKVHRRSFGRR